MGWWNLPGSDTDVMGDPPADAAADLLAPLSARDPRPTLDELLDALEAALRGASALIDGELGARHLTGEHPRTVGGAQPDLVELIGAGLPGLTGTYQDRFTRRPTLDEVVYAISFALGPEHVRGVESPGYLDVVQP